MSRLSLPLVFALALLVVPAAFAKGGHQRTVRIQGVCSQQSTSKLKLKREDRGVKVEFEVDQYRSGRLWTVTLSRNGNAVTSFTATTRAPSGSFEARRVIAAQLRTDRITAVATQADSGETCTADSSAPKVKPAAAAITTTADDHGHDSGRHS
jgi:hypothetical protein